MVLHASGTIFASQIRSEFNQNTSGTFFLGSSGRTLDSRVPQSGQLNFSSFYKKYYKPASSNLKVWLDAKEYSGSGTTWTDLQGNANGTLVNNPTYIEPYFDFNGTSQYVTLPDVTNMTDFTTSNNYTISCWVWVASTQNYTNYSDSSILEKWASSGTFPYALRYYRASKSIGGLTLGSNGFYSVYSNSNSIIVNEWNHISVVFDWTNLTISHYINGVLNASGSVPAPGTIDNNVLLYLMSRGGTRNYLTGRLGMLMIHDTALTAFDVSQLYYSTRNVFQIDSSELENGTWNVVYEYVNPKRNVSNALVTTKDNAVSLGSPTVNRIGYFMQNNMGNGDTTYWVFVTMDAYTSTLSELKIPDLVNKFINKRAVTNLRIYSNHPQVEHYNLTNGRIEILSGITTARIMGNSGGSDSGGSTPGANGGGGATQPGFSNSGSSGGNGGQGYTTDIIGTSDVYGSGGGGGRRGGSNGIGGTNAGSGGIGGSNGVSNRGGGGGGGEGAGAFGPSGGNGGSGIVVIRYDTTDSLSITATGGDSIVTTGNYKSHIFTTIGTSNFVVSKNGKCDILIVGGGGGGAGCSGNYAPGGGGGGGQIIHLENYIINSSSYSIIVGSGGNGGSGGTTGNIGSNGTSSSFDIITAIGGGGGGVAGIGGIVGTGGSGGGGGRQGTGGSATEPASNYIPDMTLKFVSTSFGWSNRSSALDNTNYGTVQVHDTVNTTTILAWNQHMYNNGSADIGFGNNNVNNINYTSGNIDWSESQNSSYNWKFQVLIGTIPIDPLTLETGTWRLLYEITDPKRNSNGMLTYTKNNSALLGDRQFTKVGYYMQNNMGNGATAYYAYVTMDTYTTSLRDLKIPDLKDNFINKKNIQNINVYSNHPQVGNYSAANGRLEIWPGDYTFSVKIMGNNGGSHSSGVYAGASGGGGATQLGASNSGSNGSTGGNGGQGYTTDITGTSDVYGSGGGGGGRGAPNGVGGTNAGTAGAPGGTGVANRGGGGGGGQSMGVATQGGNGGSGIVVIRYDTTDSLSIEATGGDSIVTTGNYKSHIYTTVGSNTFIVTKSGKCDILIVGGGGGGGGSTPTGLSSGGGGGGGKVIHLQSYVINASTYSVSVGDGGTAGQFGGSSGNGGDSSFGTITAIGGGGAGVPGSLGQAKDGGSGGGGYRGGTGGLAIAPSANAIPDVTLVYASVSSGWINSLYSIGDNTFGLGDYGAVQVHDISNSKTLIAWNNHKPNTGVDIGIGNNDATNIHYNTTGGSAPNGSNPDWTFAQNGNYNWKFQVYIKV
jgi:hypothetical protein